MRPGGDPEASGGPTDRSDRKSAAVRDGSQQSTDRTGPHRPAQGNASGGIGSDRQAGGGDGEGGRRASGGGGGEGGRRASGGGAPPGPEGHGGRSGRTILAAIAVLVVLVAGAAFLLGGGGGGGGSFDDGATNDTTITTEETDGRAATDGTDERTPTGPTVASVMKDTGSAVLPVGNATIHIEVRSTDPTGSFVQNRTIRVSPADQRFLGETRQYFEGNDSLTMTIDRYGTADVVFTRNVFPGPNESVTYGRQNRTSETIDLNTSVFQELFDFEHELTPDGDHRFTADSLDQYRGPDPENGSFEDVSALLMVDNETGLLREARFRIVGSTDRGRFAKSTNVTLGAINETTVPDPDWVSTARNRTDT